MFMGSQLILYKEISNRFSEILMTKGIAVQQGVMEEVTLELSLLRSNYLDRWRSDSDHSRQRKL